MRLRLKKILPFTLFFTLLFLLCGCLQPFIKKDISPDPPLEKTETNTLKSSPPEETATDIHQENKKVDSPEDKQIDPQGDKRSDSAQDQRADSKQENHPPIQKKEKEPFSPYKKFQPVLDDALEFCQAAQEFWQKGELENALEALDRAYALILDIDTYDKPKLIQQKEDLRFLISKRILEIYASRNIVVNGNHKAIPLVMNKYIQNEIDLFTKGKEKNYFTESYQRSGMFRPRIVPELIAAGLPVELSWLPLIESGFKVRALSRARALGLWQFIPSTGYKFGLNRNKFIDERLDPVKSTKAAIEYLKELHHIFGDWSTVLAAYNCGEGKVLQVIRKQNVNYLDNFWDLYERLPFETARYVPRFFATLHIIKDPKKYGLDLNQPDPPLEYETVDVSKQVHIKNVAKHIDVSPKILELLNPELRYKILPPEKYSLRLPPGSTETLLSKLDKIPVSSPPARKFVYHRIRRGETLSVIARRYKTSVRRIKRANNLRRSNYIIAGRLLKIPQRGYRYPTRKTVKRKYKKSYVYKVTSGDSLWIIAKRYGTTAKEIQKLNNLPGTDLHIGQVIKLPRRNNKVRLKNGLKAYEVRNGDTPFTIAKQNNMSLDRLLKINKLTAGSKIYPGQQLYVE
ncbi:MAG: LysM peptidoglycan-binding domain-containing protein [Thermodesulfobacteriota bacterium]|nr:LysM peptidoglycan-binding domain-containing protein [Thermodesulfobacteriota bacterium]